MKYVVYKDRWHGPGKYEVRTDPGEATIAYCKTRDEAQRIAHALNTKPARISPRAVVEREQKTGSILDLAFEPPGGKRVPIDKMLR